MVLEDKIMTEMVFEVIPSFLSMIAIGISLTMLFIQRSTYRKNYLEENLFDVDCRMIIISEIPTKETGGQEEENKDKNHEIEAPLYHDNGSYSIRVEDGILIELPLTFSTGGRCWLLESDIDEVRLENSTKKLKITGLMSAYISEKQSGIASHGYTVNVMTFQYIMPKARFEKGDRFNKLVIESKKIKKGVVEFELNIDANESVFGLKTGAMMIGIKDKIQR
jgi:hypothetical protein